MPPSLGGELLDVSIDGLDEGDVVVLPEGGLLRRLLGAGSVLVRRLGAGEVGRVVLREGDLEFSRAGEAVDLGGELLGLGPHLDRRDW